MKIAMFEQMANEIADAIAPIIEKYQPQIKKRKRSRFLVGYWICEGTRLAREQYYKRKPRSGGR